MTDELVKLDYRDSRGFLRRVLLPSKDFPPEEGIPVSLDLERIYGHMPVQFIVQLTEALYSRGLVEPSDFFKPGSAELVRAAILDVAKRDALDIISLAKQELERN